MSQATFVCDSCGNRKPIDELRAVTVGGLVKLMTCADCVSRERDPDEVRRVKP